MCGCAGGAPKKRARQVTKAGVRVAEPTRLASVAQIEPPYVVAAVVQVDAAALVELRAMGVTVAASTTSAKGGVALHLQGAVLSNYELWVTPASGAVTVKSAELAAS